MINEPHSGYVGLQSLDAFDNTELHFSHVRELFASNLQTIPGILIYFFNYICFQVIPIGSWSSNHGINMTRSSIMPTKLTTHTLLNTTKTKAWRSDRPTQGRCLWEYHDVWRWNTVTDQVVVLRENYFSRYSDTGKKIDWYTDCYFPLAKRWSEQVRKVLPDVIVFLEPIPNQVG